MSTPDQPGGGPPPDQPPPDQPPPGGPYPQPGPPGYPYPGPPPGVPHPTAGGPGGSGPAGGPSRLPAYLAGGLAVLLVAGLVLWLAVFHGRGRADTPQAALRSYLEAAKRHDLNGFKALSCQADLDVIDRDPAERFIPDSWVVVSYTITRQRDIDGGVTMVGGAMTIQESGQPYIGTFELAVLTEGGRYKVCVNRSPSSAELTPLSPTPTSSPR